MPRQRRLLADVSPELAEVYDPDSPVPFGDVPLVSTDRFRLRCRHRYDRHDWEETIGARRSLKPSWKLDTGGILARPWCERLWVKMACGHRRRCSPGEEIDDTQPCTPCRRAADPEVQAANRERAYWAPHEDEVRRAVADLEAGLPTVEGPDVLVREVRQRRQGLLQKAVYATVVHATPDQAAQWVDAAAAITIDTVMPRLFGRVELGRLVARWSLAGERVGAHRAGRRGMQRRDPDVDVWVEQPLRHERVPPQVDAVGHPSVVGVVLGGVPIDVARRLQPRIVRSHSVDPRRGLGGVEGCDPHHPILGEP